MLMRAFRFYFQHIYVNNIKGNYITVTDIPEEVTGAFQMFPYSDVTFFTEKNISRHLDTQIYIMKTTQL
jgi:hypothetical protein